MTFVDEDSLSLVWGCGRSSKKSGLESGYVHLKSEIPMIKLLQILLLMDIVVHQMVRISYIILYLMCILFFLFIFDTIVFEGSSSALEHQYLAKSEDMEGSSDFVALGERSESKAVSDNRIC